MIDDLSELHLYTSQLIVNSNLLCHPTRLSDAHFKKAGFGDGDIEIHVNPSEEQAADFTDGILYNNAALRLEAQGRLAEAERAHLQAIRAKEGALGTDHFTTAVSYNGLGELYLYKTARLDKAEEYLQKALRVRERSGPKSDLAVTRDNMAKLYEVKGDLQAAERIRLAGKPDNIACGNYDCPKITNLLSKLSRCKVCKAIFYCSRPCQIADWKRHKRYCRARTQEAEV